MSRHENLALPSTWGSETLEVCVGGSIGVYLVTLLAQGSAVPLGVNPPMGWDATVANAGYNIPTAADGRVQVAAANGRAAAVMADMEIYVDGGNGGDQAKEDTWVVGKKHGWRGNGPWMKRMR